MSAMLADIDATCASLGYYDGAKYIPEPDALQGLKHLIWILRRDGDTHEYRRHLGSSKVMETDLIPMMIHQSEGNEMSDVLLRLLVNLTSPTLLLYNEVLPKDGPNRRIFLHLVEILQTYKSAFSTSSLWEVLCKRLQKVLEIDAVERTEEKSLLVERSLALIRNILHVPSNPSAECRADNDASLHDQVLWALQQAGILDMVLFIVGSEHESQYHFHALEIICLMYREQKVESLANVSLQRSAAEKHSDEQELVLARKRESTKNTTKPPPGRHSRFGGTYIIRNIKSVSNRDVICHQSLEQAVVMDFDRDKDKRKQSFRVAKEQAPVERRSAFSIRLFLRQFAVEVLRSALNNLIRQVRRILERNSFGHDDSYLLWAIRFFLEFNRMSSFELALVSEALSTTTFHWTIARVQHHLDMLTSDKKNVVQWQKRLHIAVQAFKELLLSLVALQKMQDDSAKALLRMLQNNVCYVHEFRETVFHTMTSYNENQNTKSYLRDVVETAHIFFKLMEKFCNGRAIVQTKHKVKSKQRSKAKKTNSNKGTASKEENRTNSEDMWSKIAPQISAILSSNRISLPEEEHPMPFDAAIETPIEEQKDTCMVRIHNLLSKEKFEHAVILLRSAREIWPENDCFGVSTVLPEDELWLLRDIFNSNLNSDSVDRDEEQESSEEDDDDDENNDENECQVSSEVEFRFDDFVKRLVNPKIVRTCTIVLGDWETISGQTIKSAITILHRIAFVSKMPIMLFQAPLFRIFQKVMNTPKEPRYDDIRRLSIYIMRQFTEIAKINPKVYAELFFYKSVKEANDIESGYDDNLYAQNNKKVLWNEEQEDELRRLFEENQTNPSTEQDVIDWILENLIDKNRNRRAIIKKLKEMELIFKAPTKKSVRAGVSKDVWHYDEDVKLKDLYDTYRLNDDCLDEIMRTFVDKRSRNNVINRMITLGLIAERSEILPSKRKKSNIANSKNDSDSDSDSSSSSSNFNRPVKITVKQNKSKKSGSNSIPPKSRSVNKLPEVSLDIAAVKCIISNIDVESKEHLDWIIEALNDAAEDAEDDEDDGDDADGVPLVPFSIAQKTALKTECFESLLTALGMQKPSKEMETYWRIPVSMTANDIRLRAKLLSGDAMDDEEAEKAKSSISISSRNIESDNDSDGSIDQMSINRKNVRERLIYNDSDDESDSEMNLVNKENKSSDINQLSDAASNSPEDNDDLKGINADTNVENDQNEFNSEDFNSQSIRQRLADLGDSENMDELEEISSKPNKRSRVENPFASSDDDDDPEAPITSFRKKKAKMIVDDD